MMTTSSDWTSADALPVVISLAALAVSILATLYNVMARPIVAADPSEEYLQMGSLGPAHLRGYNVFVYNLGRRAVVLQSVGILGENGRTVRSPGPTFSWGDESVSNPDVPEVLAPGGVLKFRLPHSLVRDESAPVTVRVVSVRRRAWSGSARTKHLDVTVKKRPPQLGADD